MFNSIRADIVQIASDIQELVDLEFEKVNNKPPQGSKLDQVNLKGGDKVIFEYLVDGEYGVAFEHLLYMIEETAILISNKQKLKIGELSRIMKIDITGFKSIIYDSDL